METFNRLTEYCQANERVCPMPQQWLALYNMLKNTRRTPPGGGEPSLPLILAAWDDTPAIMKILRLREHIEWAQKQGQLEEISIFLRNLPENHWFHLGE